jgi:hypothetical protein
VHPEPDSCGWTELYSDGDDACDLVASFNLVCDKWQHDVVEAWLKRSQDDKFVATQCGLSVPRQNGKNEILIVREMYGLLCIGEQILHTAHRVDTARKSFLRLVNFFENPKYPELKDMVLQIRRTNGQEAIRLKNNASIEFSSRVNGGARGSTYDVVVFDEAQELTDDQMESIMSTMAAAPLQNRQMLFTGTPPSPVSPGTVFRRTRKSALEGKNKHIVWHEWSVEEIGDISDKTRWYDTNPALGVRLDEEFTEDEFNTMKVDGFARERLGWWGGETGANCVFKKADWLACAVEDLPDGDEKDVLAYGVKFTPDAQHVALSVAVKNPNYSTIVECLEYRPIISGIGWLADWICERKNKCAVCVIDGRSYTATLKQKLEEGGFPQRGIVVATPETVIASAQMFYDAVIARELMHISPTNLDDSVISAQKRQIGSNGGWGFGSGLFDCALVESVSLAFWGVKTTKRKPGRKMRLL